MTDETGRSAPDDGTPPSSRPEPETGYESGGRPPGPWTPAEARESDRPAPEPARPAQWAPAPDHTAASEPWRPPQGEPHRAPAPGAPMGAPRQAPPPGAPGGPGPAAPAGHYGPPGPGGGPMNTGEFPSFSGPSGPGGPGGPAGPGGPGGPNGPGTPAAGAPSGPGGPTGSWPPAAQWRPEEPRRRRYVPLWGLVASVLVATLVAAGIGGAVGGMVGAGSAGPEPGGGNLGNDVPEGTPSRAPDTIAGVAQRVSPSVVSIRPSGRENGGNGSGFVIHDDYVVTNNHVAAALRDGGIEVAYSDDHKTEAKVVGAAPSADLAVLELTDPANVDALEFGDSDEVTVGDEVIAIGAPLGLDGTVTTGIISAKDRPVSLGEEGSETYISALQTDAAINPGNSGGPLVDAEGRVIGVNSAIATTGGGGESGGQAGSIGLGFAITAKQAEMVVDQLVDTGSAEHAVLGANLDVRYQGGGARIISDKDAGGDAVVDGGPADDAGLKPGDVIVEFDGSKVGDANELIKRIRDKKPRDRVEVVYERGGGKKTVTVELGSSKE